MKFGAAPAISGPRADSPGTAAVRVSTSSFTSLENSVPSRAMLTRYAASARGARARRSYDRIMDDNT
jgi:hypothetical protein